MNWFRWILSRPWERIEHPVKRYPLHLLAGDVVVLGGRRYVATEDTVIRSERDVLVYLAIEGE